MKLSANMAAYAVLIVAVVLVGVYVTGIETSTDVSTIEESLLPNVYPPEGQSISNDIQGVSFRYPAGWQVESQPDSLILSRAVDRFDESEGRYAFSIAIAPQAGEEALTPADLLPEETANAEVTTLERGGLPAVRAFASGESGIGLYEVVQLSDNNVFLTLQNNSAISQEAWEDISDDIDGVLNSIHAEDVTVIADAFTFTTPDGWEELNSERTFFTVLTPDSQAPAAGVRVGVFPPDLMLATLPQLLPVPPGTVDLSIAGDPITAMELYAELPGLPVEITDELQDVTYFGYDGKLIGHNSPELGYLRVAVLDTEDGNFALILVNILSGEGYEVYEAGVDELLGSIEYTTPDPSLFGQ